MAASDARPVPRRNVAYRATFPILDADGDLVPGAAGLDSEVSIDGTGFVDCTNEATEIAPASGMYFLDLTAAEMGAATVAVLVKTTTPGAKTTPLVFYPSMAPRLVLVHTPLFERSSTVTLSYTVQLHIFDDNNVPLAADANPTLAAFGTATPNLTSNLVGPTVISTGVYQWTYNVPISHLVQQVRFDVTAAVASLFYAESSFTQVSAQDVILANAAHGGTSATLALWFVTIGGGSGVGVTVTGGGNSAAVSLSSTGTSPAVIVSGGSAPGMRVISSTTVAMDLTSPTTPYNMAVANQFRDRILTDSTPFAGADIPAIKADTAAILLQTGTDGVIVAPDGLDAVVVETGVNARQVLAAVGAALAGKAVRAGDTITYYAMGNPTIPRVSGVTEAGGRDDVTLTLPATP